MKDIHDFASAAIPGVMLELLVTKKPLNTDILVEKAYEIGQAMMREAVKRGFTITNSTTFEDEIAKADELYSEFNKTKKVTKVTFDVDGEPLPVFEDDSDEALMQELAELVTR